MAERQKKESMIEDRVTIAVRYPLTGPVPTLDSTVDAVTGPFEGEGPDEEGYDARFVVLSKSRKTVRVPVAEPEPASDG